MDEGEEPVANLRVVPASGTMAEPLALTLKMYNKGGPPFGFKESCIWQKCGVMRAKEL